MAGGWCENRRAGVCDQTSVHTEAGTQHFAVIITEKAPSPFLKHLNFVDTFTSVWQGCLGCLETRGSLHPSSLLQ